MVRKKTTRGRSAAHAQPDVPPPVTRDALVTELDAAIERTQKRRVALRLAERAMLEARRAVERFDQEAARQRGPVCSRCAHPIAGGTGRSGS